MPLSLEELIDDLSQSGRQETADELLALDAIYPSSLIPLDPAFDSEQTLHLRLALSSIADHNVPLSLIISLPAQYPATRAPVLQLERCSCCSSINIFRALQEIAST